MRVGHTFTRHFDLETRQHELLGMDLGEGPSRRVLVTGAVVYAVWMGALFLIFGWPSQVFFTLYFAPPALITFYGSQRSRRNERRWNLTQWALTIRYLTVGHRPIINGGRRAAGRSEWLPLRARLGEKSEDVLSLPGMGLFERFLGDEEPQRTSGRAVVLEARPRLYGPDHVYRARSRSQSSPKARTAQKTQTAPMAHSAPIAHSAQQPQAAPGRGRKGRKGTQGTR